MIVVKRAIGVVIMVLSISSIGHAADAASAWQVEWEQVLEAARKEGQVTLYFKAGYDGVVPAFQKKYPKIKVVTVAGEAADMTNRLLAERRGEKYIADVFTIGIRSAESIMRAGAVEGIRPLLLLPEVLDETKWFQGHVYSDSEKKYIFRYLSVAEQGIGYNKDLLKDPKQMQSYWHFLNPKWKGKIVARDLRTPGPGNGNMSFWYHNPELGPNFVRRLYSEMDITLTRSSRQATDWLAQGKFTFCFFCSGFIEKAEAQGVPVGILDVDWKEGAGIVSQSGNLLYMKNAPHPNAARVFINWLLSREGQIEIQRVLANVQPAESRRIDIPKDDVPPNIRRTQGGKYIDMDSRPEYRDRKPFLKLLAEVLNR